MNTTANQVENPLTLPEKTELTVSIKMSPAITALIDQLDKQTGGNGRSAYIRGIIYAHLKEIAPKLFAEALAQN